MSHNRYNPPVISPLSNIHLPIYQKYQLDNGIPVYMLPFGRLDVIELMVVFRAGSCHQERVGLAGFTARNMPEGTSSYSGLQIAQLLDEHGAWINHDLGEEFVSFQLASLTESLQDLLPIFREVLFEPKFGETDFEQMKQRTLQRLQVESKKTSVMAYRHFGHQLFGANHSYGKHLGYEEMQNITREDILSYHSSYYQPGNSFIVAVGKFDEGDTLKQLNTTFGALPVNIKNESPSAALLPVETPPKGRFHYEMEGPQSTLRAGHLGFPRNHPDYYGMSILNTLLGGFFGSRLMHNIREEKGYTYGIYSGWVSYPYNGYFVVQSDVANEYVDATLLEIKKEIRRLQEESISEGELELVKNYLLGNSINMRETPFQVGNILRYALVNELPFSELDRKFDVIRNISATELQLLAQEHFRPDDLLEIVCGMEAKA